MPDSKVSALATVTPAGADFIYLIQGGASKKTTLSNVLALVPAADPAGTAASYRDATFANDAARALAVPTYVGQPGKQTDTGVRYLSTGLLAGNWTEDLFTTAQYAALYDATTLKWLRLNRPLAQINDDRNQYFQDKNGTIALTSDITDHNALATAHAAATNLVHPNDDTTLDELTLTDDLVMDIVVPGVKSPLVAMIANDQPYPSLQVASLIDSTTPVPQDYNGAWKAFDETTVGADVNGWVLPIFLTIDLGTGHSIAATKYKVKTFAGNGPKTWTFEGSNDGVNWDVLDTQTNYTAWVTLTFSEFTFTNTTAYRYYRWNVTVQENTGSWLQFVECEIYPDDSVNKLTIAPGAQTADHAATFPDKDGTVAMTSDVSGVQNVIFADAAARAAAVPAYIGQSGRQTDTGVKYRSTGLAAGNWTEDVLVTENGIEFHDTVTGFDGKLYFPTSGLSADRVLSFPDKDATLGTTNDRNRTFANDAGRAAAVPEYTNQLGRQTDTGAWYRASGAGAGDWTLDFTGGFTPNLFQIDFSAHLPTSKSSTSWTRANNYTYLKAFEYANSTNADLEWIEYTITLPAGTYTIDLACAIHGNGGFLELYIDGTIVGTAIDLYGSFTPANISQITGVSITAGSHAIRLKVNGHHASSGGYQLYPHGITFRKTA